MGNLPRASITGDVYQICEIVPRAMCGEMRLGE
jgi:hypothetical protein